MTIRYAQQFVGQKDGTSLPPKKLDGSIIGAKVRRIRADKVPFADQVADQVFIGTLPAGSNPSAFIGHTDTTLGTTTISIGTLTVPGKYVSGKTLTTVDVPTLLGPKVTGAQQATLVADEDIYVTFAVAAVPVGALVTFTTEYTISA